VPASSLKQVAAGNLATDSCEPRPLRHSGYLRLVKKYTRDDQRVMTTWALDCAERVLALFEAARPDDDRPRAAIAAGRAWVRTGQFSMSVIRNASLGAHAAAKATDDAAAAAAAHAAGQAVATAHVPQHAYGGAYYALRAIAAANPSRAAAEAERERSWQTAQLPERLRAEIMSRLLVEEDTRGVRVTVRKGRGF
jgi:hypothetical protein